MIKELRKQHHEAIEKLEQLNNWLKNNISHPDFQLIVSDRNHLLVKINALDFKINQLQHGLPLLGEPMPMTTCVSLSTIQENKTV